MIRRCTPYRFSPAASKQTFRKSAGEKRQMAKSLRLPYRTVIKAVMLHQKSYEARAARTTDNDRMLCNVLPGLLPRRKRYITSAYFGLSWLE